MADHLASLLAVPAQTVTLEQTAGHLSEQHSITPQYNTTSDRTAQYNS